MKLFLRRIISHVLLTSLIIGYHAQASQEAAAEVSYAQSPFVVRRESIDEPQTIANTAIAPELTEVEEASSAHVSADEKEKEMPQKIIQLLTIFLDNYEAAPDSLMDSVTSSFLTALYDEAGPIVASSSLLYNLLEGPFTTREPVIAETFKKYFNNGDTWILKEIKNSYQQKTDPSLIVMIPLSYLAKKDISLESIRLLGLNVDPETALIKENTTLLIDDIIQRYINYLPSEWDDLRALTGTAFIDALKKNLIFDPHNQQVEWVIYLNGHGIYNKHIANINVDDFPSMLDFFNTKINVALFIYNSCYSGGLNAATIYGELTNKKNIAKEYSFPIIAEAITDASTSGPGIGIDFSKGKLKLLFPYQFNTFINQFITDKIDYQQSLLNKKPLENPYTKSLTYLMPYLTAYEESTEKQKEEKQEHENETSAHYYEKAINPNIYPGNLPQIRFPHSPAWFPVVGSTPSIVRITKTMALTRTEPLKLKTTGKEQLIQKVLIDTDYIPFDIIINEIPWEILTTKDIPSPQFIITLPGDAGVYIKKIIQKNYTRGMDIPDLLNLNFKKPFYEGKKTVYIQEYSKKFEDDLPASYKDIIIFYSSGTMYYTDQDNKQWLIDKTGTSSCPFNYLIKHRYYFTYYQKLKKYYETKRSELQNIPAMEIKKRELQKIPPLGMKPLHE